MNANIHDFSREELEEVFTDARLAYMAAGDRAAFVLRLRMLGITSTEITAELRELDIKRLEAFNAKLEKVRKRNGNAA